VRKRGRFWFCGLPGIPYSKYAKFPGTQAKIGMIRFYELRFGKFPLNYLLRLSYFILPAGNTSVKCLDFFLMSFEENFPKIRT